MTGSSLNRWRWLGAGVITVGMGAAVVLQRWERAAAPTDPAPAAAVALASPVHVIPAEAPARDAENIAAVAQLRQELARLHQAIAVRERDLRDRAARPHPAPAERSTLTEAFLSPDAWTDAGNESPAALMETALAAGAGGDVARMAGLLVYDDETLAAANALYERLPAELRSEQADGRALIALLATESVPLVGARLAENLPTDTGDRELLLQLHQTVETDGRLPAIQLRHVKLTARQDESTGAWRFVVPPTAIAKFATQLGLAPALPDAR